MTDIIGVLGESTQVAVGTYTVYQVPTGKAAKGRLMFHGVAQNTSTVKFLVNGIPIAAPAAATGADNIFSSNAAMTENTTTTAPTGADDATVVAPTPIDYYLSAGDLVQMVIGVADFTSMNAQFVGAEVDVT